ncbi:UdgX family uracil-DNA binding protein [Variovorax sp. KK3]|uniref:UdgX family uracil-DNA binding protein n=1 Tax=Variovorax sp. KK3 TaxID=1855728 RepID=UPI00097BE375|nr:UdgX family uracil-DNA binding protein [Variovorax sp. KK3]
MVQHLVTLDGETDWPGFRREARALIAALVPPEQVDWCTRDDSTAGLFAETSTPPPARTPTNRTAQLVVPASFVALCEAVILHADPERFALLYRLLWRLMHEPGLRGDPLDPDRIRARRMAQAVKTDMHKMKAFVRFREVDAHDGGGPLHVAWFEPTHHVVEAVAPFFMRRFAQMRWAILTPRRSIRWNGELLELGPGAARDDAPPADAGEALWLTYYAHTFNPARLNLAQMRKEMPRRYWHNLPESPLIDTLAHDAPVRSADMIEAAPSVPSRRIPIAVNDVRSREFAMATNAETIALPDDPERALAILREATDHCRECPIGAHATQSVFGEGPVGATVMVVGEQPGDQEDLQGKPFVGPSGRLFDQAVADLGWSREQLYVTNAVKHFKFELRGKRRMHKTPGQREVAACLHWLDSEIEQVRPQAFIALGATAARALLGRPVAVMRERGQWHTDARGLPVLVTLHPSALLRGDPAERESAYAAWLDDLALASDRMGAAREAGQKR